MSVFNRIAKYFPASDAARISKLSPQEAIASLDDGLGDMWRGDRIKLVIVLKDIITRIERLEEWSDR